MGCYKPKNESQKTIHQQTFKGLNVYSKETLHSNWQGNLEPFTAILSNVEPSKSPQPMCHVNPHLWAAPIALKFRWTVSRCNWTPKSHSDKLLGAGVFGQTEMIAGFVSYIMSP